MSDGYADAFGRASEFVDLSMWRRATPGMVLGITDRQRTLFATAKGFSDAISRRPLSADALFQIGSVSKSFTCIALLQAAERGEVDLHQPVTRYLPWFSVRSRYSDITLHHLMTHTGGIVLGSDATPTAWTEVWDLRDEEAACEPGTHFHYSNSGYKALGLVLETVTGKPYGRVIREGVLQAAGMRSTEPVITNAARGRQAVAHLPLHDDRPSNRRSEMYPAPWFESDTGDGSICAPLEDMLAYVRLLLNGGEGPWGRAVSPESFRLMTTPYIVPQDEVHVGAYGYGLNIETVDGHRYLGHQGGMVGHYTSMLMDMDSGLGAMVMINGPGDAEEVARFALECMRGSGEGRLPNVPARAEAFRRTGATDFAGTFAGGDGSFDVIERDGTLHLSRGGREAVLEPRDGDSFFADAEGLELFLLEFEREGGKVVRAHHGPRTYARGGGPTGRSDHAAVRPVRYEGHYRSHNPWLSNFRVVDRMGGLAYVLPDSAAKPLVHLEGHAFRIGGEESSPERIVFGGVIDGVATSAVVSGGGRFGRTFTP